MQPDGVRSSPWGPHRAIRIPRKARIPGVGTLISNLNVRCRSLASTLRETGRLLWVGGYLLGSDRVTRSSPFGFGSDATVGLATVVQIAGELMDGAASLLDRENIYGAAALIRQLVEIEYLS